MMSSLLLLMFVSSKENLNQTPSISTTPLEMCKCPCPHSMKLISLNVIFVRPIQPLGFQVERCPQFLRAYVSAFNHPFGPHDTVTANHRCLGGHILKVGKHCTFTPDDVQAALQSCASLPSPPRLSPFWLLVMPEPTHLIPAPPCVSVLSTFVVPLLSRLSQGREMLLTNVPPCAHSQVPLPMELLHLILTIGSRMEPRFATGLSCAS